MAAQTPTHSEDAASSLTMAIVASSPGPLLLLDGDLNIVAASASFCAAFEVDPSTVPGRTLASLGAGEWDVPQLQSLLSATASGAAKIEAYDMDLERPGRETLHLVVHAQRLVYLDLQNLRLLIAVTDTTDVRLGEKLKDEALRENLILLQEVRHRVANSLQIIASVLLQNAKRTQSEETRSHLKDAHHRVMSIAALERQLAVTGDNDVELLGYFKSLCASISASMIADGDHVSITVTGGGGLVGARVSVSLGLIVTELVINALKHAFPYGRPGKIVVDFGYRGPNWVLSVSDDGVGMPSDPALVRAGLGSSIVQALAGQLQAVVASRAAAPGPRVVITHTQIALINGGEMPDAAASAAERPAAAGIG